jgi:hypothetical protein
MKKLILLVLAAASASCSTAPRPASISERAPASNRRIVPEDTAIGQFYRLKHIAENSGQRYSLAAALNLARRDLSDLETPGLERMVLAEADYPRLPDPRGISMSDLDKVLRPLGFGRDQVDHFQRMALAEVAASGLKNSEILTSGQTLDFLEFDTPLVDQLQQLVHRFKDTNTIQEIVTRYYLVDALLVGAKSPWEHVRPGTLTLDVAAYALKTGVSAQEAFEEVTSQMEGISLLNPYKPDLGTRGFLSIKSLFEFVRRIAEEKPGFRLRDAVPVLLESQKEVAVKSSLLSRFTEGGDAAIWIKEVARNSIHYGIPIKTSFDQVLRAYRFRVLNEGGGHALERVFLDILNGVPPR